jgi:hypothetical protein
MTKGSDERGKLSELKLCELVGVTQQHRQSLVRRGMLDAAPAAGCSQTDAIELATLASLGRHLSPSELAVAWSELRLQLRDVVPKGRLDVVFDRELGSTQIVRDDQALRTAVISGRPMRIVELGPRLQEVLDAFRRWAAIPTSAPRGTSNRRRDSHAG